VNEKSDEAAARSDRALVLNLLGRTTQACEDVAQALKLQQEQRAAVEPMLRHELTVRQAACKQERTMAGKD
jgi:Flp pilus assembly protein TadD